MAHTLSRRSLIRVALTGVATWLVGSHRRPGRFPPLDEATAGAAGAPPPQLPGMPPDKPTSSGIVVSPDDPGILARPVEYPGTVSRLLGYLSTPAGGEVYPGVLVLHDADGLTEHTRDVTRRLAKAGYVALAPDLLSRAGGTAQVQEAQRAAALSTMAPTQFLQDLNTSVAYLEARPLAAKTRIGALGFGLGGALSWLLVARNHDLKAAVTFYGGIPSLSIVGQIQAAVLAVFGDAEHADLAELPDLDAAMKKAGLPWSYKIEPKAGRGFFDDTRRGTYAPDAAKDGWRLTLEWYGTYLGR